MMLSIRKSVLVICGIAAFGLSILMVRSYCWPAPSDGDTAIVTAGIDNGVAEMKGVNWDLVRDDSKWVYANWGELSQEMFRARSLDPQRMAVIQEYDDDKDGQVDPHLKQQYTQARQQLRYEREQKAADLIFQRFDTDGNHIIDEREITIVRQTFSVYLKEKRNTPESAFCFARLGRDICDEDGDRILGIAEQAILSRLEEFWIWPPGNPAIYDPATLRVRPWDTIKREQLLVTKSPATTSQDSGEP